MSELNVQQLALEYDNASPRKILELALENIDNIAVSFSGAEDVVLIDIARKVRKDIRVFSLDTGRLHPETYEFIDRVRKHYGIDIEIMTPDSELLQPFVQEKGLFSFFEDGHNECCGIRKIEPLKRKLATLDGWITGQRKDQSPTRSDVPVIQHDHTFSGPGKNLIKFNPLSNWTSEQVWDYIHMFDVPYNKLHEQGFTSIGCQPCTRPVLPNQHEREGRWWWEEATHKECGLHAANIESKS
ncbi:phosphoadenylyl-sulfate reductase [Litoribrevibacter euphylliae]|uniref:Adenosine 5'-phosphosulfate reductase n=1 Tax=Litoribrevibacter euphylliae TaxID=1834034 RepID=A0ABV7HEY4_9GAMM